MALLRVKQGMLYYAWILKQVNLHGNWIILLASSVFPNKE